MHLFTKMEVWAANDIKVAMHRLVSLQLSSNRFIVIAEAQYTIFTSCDCTRSIFLLKFSCATCIDQQNTCPFRKSTCFCEMWLLDPYPCAYYQWA